MGIRFLVVSACVLRNVDSSSYEESQGMMWVVHRLCALGLTPMVIMKSVCC